MKILVAATACHPTSGSEAQVGWSAVSAIRHEHDVWVMTSEWCREAVEKWTKGEESWKHVRFIYVDESLGLPPYSENRLIARFQSWLRYRIWCQKAANVASQLHQEVGFDVAHHVTYATWRMGSPLSSLGIPWIWGPIGGGELFPWRLIGTLSPVACVFEIFRSVSSAFSRRTEAVRRAIRDASEIIASNDETIDFLLRIATPSRPPTILSQAFLDSEKISRLKRCCCIRPADEGIMEIVSGGNLEGRKGVAISLKALSIVKREGIPFRYRHFGGGAERAHLVALTAKLGLSNQVDFLAPLAGAEYEQMLKSAHVYLLPSLRESAGITLIEAIAAGCVPVVTEGGGPDAIVRSGGIKPISIAGVDQMAEEIALRLLEYWRNKKSWIALSEQASSKIAAEYSSSHYAETIATIYKKVREG
jgi:glycosyltransferase involved in cell wall biosynthesis